MIQDFCGGLEEELMRTNFILIYELIDELIVSTFKETNAIKGLWAPSDYKHRDLKKVCRYLG